MPLFEMEASWIPVSMGMTIAEIGWEGIQDREGVGREQSYLRHIALVLRQP